MHTNCNIFLIKLINWFFFNCRCVHSYKPAFKRHAFTALSSTPLWKSFKKKIRILFSTLIQTIKFKFNLIQISWTIWQRTIWVSIMQGYTAHLIPIHLIHNEEVLCQNIKKLLSEHVFLIYDIIWIIISWNVYLYY